jgi:hypothetical protein
MRHLSEGALRRIYDEPLALTAVEQSHFDSCAECQAQFQSVAGTARAATALLQTTAFEPQPAPALSSMRQRLAEEAGRPSSWYVRWLDRNAFRLRPLATPAIALAIAAVMLTGVAATGVAARLVRVFEPGQVVGVQVSPSAISSANLRLDYGQVKWLPAPPQAQQVTDAATAGSVSGLPVLTPASLPTGVTGIPTYGVISHATGSLTFDAARLAASARQHGISVKAMPANINGSTLVVNGGPALIEVWGLSSGRSEAQFPTLVIAQTRVPTVDSTGASTDDLENYLLSQPGVPPELAAQVKAIKDPSTTLPIPIPQGLATSQAVQVNGVQGLLIKAVLGAGVVWVKNGVIYAVGGQLTPDQVLAIATALH